MVHFIEFLMTMQVIRQTGCMRKFQAHKMNLNIQTVHTLTWMQLPCQLGSLNITLICFLSIHINPCRTNLK